MIPQEREINKQTKQGKYKTKRNPVSSNKIKQEKIYFITGPDKEANMETKTTQELHSKYSDVFTGIGCFEGTFSLQVKE